MLATEHADRFTVALPNGGTMDVFKADLRPETAAELRSMVVPGFSKGGEVDDPTDPKRFGRKGAENTKRAKQDEIDALEDQLAGLEAQAQGDEYADTPEPSAADYEVAQAADREAEFGELAAAQAELSRRNRAQGSAEADAALISRSDAIERKRDEGKANVAFLDAQNADYAAQQAALAEAERQRVENAAANIGAPAPAMVESDTARAAREAREQQEAVDRRTEQLARIAAIDPAVIRYARYGIGDSRDAATLKSGLGSIGVEAVPTPSRLSSGRMDEIARGALPNRFWRDKPTLDMNAATRVQPDAVVLTPEQAKTAGEAVAGMDVPPPIAPPAPPVDPDAEKKAKFSQFMQGAEERKPFTPLSVGAATPFDATGINNAFDAAQQANKAIADFDMKAGALREQREIDAELKKRAMIDRHDAERIAEHRRLDQMREDAYNGKIDVNRAFDRMDNGQRALSLIGLILGGIGAGNTGVNAALGVMERMIDRDIDAQAKDLGRKQAAYSNAIQQGYQAEQARQVAKAEAFSLLDGAIARAAAKSNSDRAMLNAQAMNAELGVKRENTLTQARDAHEARDGQRLDRQLRADGMNLELQLKREANEIARKSATIKAMLKSRSAEDKLSVTLPDGTVVVATDPTARSDLSRKQTAHQEFVRGLDMLDAMRRKNPGGRIVPGFLAWLGIPAAEASKVGDSLAGAVRLAYLKAQGAGAYDKGSGELSQHIIQDPTSFFGTGSDTNYFDATSKLRELANSSFLSTITANTRGGNVYEVNPTAIGAE